MNNDVVKLKDYKTIKKFKRYVEDIDKLLHILITSQKALSFFKQYVVAQEMISVMETNKTFLELHLKKYEKKLAQLTGEHSEKSENRPEV